MNQVKIYDVAGAAGVSLATVSRVLNHPEKVKPATRERIEKIIKELGYKPNLNAKGLASSKSTTVAIMVPELTRSSVAEMINGIADCARRRGYLLRLFVNNNRGQEAPIESEKELWGDVIASGVDGVLYINDELTNEHLELIMEASVDVVLTNTICNDPGVPSVSIDYVKAAYDITKEMIARGNKKIWMITSIRKYMVNDLKVQGYNKAMQEAGLEPKVIPVSGKTELNEATYREILSEGYPEVAIVVRDSMAVSFINIARTLGIRIPDQLQVIGFQNTRYAVLSRPKLTCINTPIYELGEAAMNLLTNLMEEKMGEDVENLQQLIDYNIVWRETTK
ncbi:MAG TPA: LacI family DNA-binding transcriptional regulator [Bacilli bacterium]|jgi:LacI family transcriptional regulator|nr:MAG: Catabolite control protein A [Tenericutes bacterium ADurb.Bin140]HOE77297.1 LacI family DNA-binding transcriptional regulator [Bacilli bacterium]HON63335.1 LacI family DNA-binding transcriptional regulator [Bacilli bacterium]HOR95235.1 LacI family DNA-binding transcriptional regulator [Bacilli bacterium]HPD11785.1 LacI family DNA-binding transcriptional regulator [Bacilli bacterium]